MNGIVRTYINGYERLRTVLRSGAKAQTMTEYALILAAVAIVAYITYQVMGQDIGSMVNNIDSRLLVIICHGQSKYRLDGDHTNPQLVCSISSPQHKRTSKARLYMSGIRRERARRQRNCSIRTNS